MWLTNGVHFIQVAKWLGHSSYVLTLTTYADYIPEQEAENPLPEPIAAVPKTNVLQLQLHRAGRLAAGASCRACRHVGSQRRFGSDGMGGQPFEQQVRYCVGLLIEHPVRPVQGLEAVLAADVAPSVAGTLVRVGRCRRRSTRTSWGQ